jgi:glycosyltransferase involved in cell wall biosynthesis
MAISKPRFSVVLIAKNEEESLPNLLRSLWEFRDRGGQVILVDTGSTDKTMEIADHTGCIVYEKGDAFRHPIDQGMADKINRAFIVDGEAPIVKGGDSYFDFGEARAYAMSLASNDFVLCPGCDEVFTKLDIDALHRFMDEGYSQIRFDYIWDKTPEGKPRTRFYRDAYFFDRTKWHWVNPIHEFVMENVPGEKWMELPAQYGLVEHHQLPQPGRNLRDAVGLGVSCYQDRKNDRNAHYFARELMFQHRYRSAINQFLRHFDLKSWDLERGQSLTFIGDCYWFMGNEKEATFWYQESFNFCAARRAPLCRLADLYHQKDDKQRAAAYAAAALTIPYIAYYANDMSHYRHFPHEILYWALWYLGAKEQAKAHWKKCIEYEPTNKKFIEEGEKFFDYKPAGPK